MAFFKKSKCFAIAAGWTSWGHLSYWTIHGSDVQRAVFKIQLKKIYPTYHFLWRSFELVLPDELRQKLGIKSVYHEANFVALIDFSLFELNRSIISSSRKLMRQKKKLFQVKKFV